MVLAQEAFQGTIRSLGAATVSVQYTADKLSAESKVCLFYIFFGITEQVLWLQVLEDITLLVAVLPSG